MHLLIGNSYYLIGRYDVALKNYNESLALYTKTDDNAGRSAALRNIGIVHIERGELLKALKYFQQALTISKEINDKLGEASTLNSLGVVYT